MKTTKKKKTITKTKKKAAPHKKRSTAFKSGLSGFAVIWRHTMDDIPIGLYADEKDAVRVAEKITFKAAYKIARGLDINCSTPVCFGYVKFVKGQAKNFINVDREDDA